MILAQSFSGYTSLGLERQLLAWLLPLSGLGRIIPSLERTKQGDTMLPRLSFESVVIICWLKGCVCAASPAKPQMTCHGRRFGDWLWIVQTC